MVTHSSAHSSIHLCIGARRRAVDAGVPAVHTEEELTVYRVGASVRVPARHGEPFGGNYFGCYSGGNYFGGRPKQRYSRRCGTREVHGSGGLPWMTLGFLLPCLVCFCWICGVFDDCREECCSTPPAFDLPDPPTAEACAPPVRRAERGGRRRT